jgi:hypothetical protein
MTPWIALISTMKKVPQKIRKYFEVSPMPNQITAMGIMAVGERKRKNSITGSSRSWIQRIRPMSTPSTIPSALPSANPTATRSTLAAIWRGISAVASMGTAVLSTSAGGGIRCGLTR